MSLTDLATIASVVSSLAVAISLIYLALQVHQNTKHTRALIRQGRAARASAQAIAMADSDLAAAYIVGNGRVATPDEVKRRQFILQCLAHFTGWEDAFFQHEDGLLNDEQFARFRVLVADVFRRDPGVRESFQLLKITSQGGARTRFGTFVDELVAQSESVPQAAN